MKFIKMHSARNDFVIIDQRNGLENTIDAKTIADRKSGVGCDQVIVLRDSENHTCTMLVFNSDGTQSNMCGNAAQCIGDLLIKDSMQSCTIELSDKKIVTCSKIGGAVSVNMGKPSFNWQDIPLRNEVYTLSVPLAGLPDYINSNPVAVNIGNPHLVFFVDKCEQKYIEELGKFEKHPLFPEHTNVEIMEVTSRNSANLKIWERGVGITESCGSGACASFAAAFKMGLVDSAVKIQVPGGELKVSYNENGDIILNGKIEYVFEGTFIDKSI